MCAQLVSRRGLLRFLDGFTFLAIAQEDECVPRACVHASHRGTWLPDLAMWRESLLPNEHTGTHGAQGRRGLVITSSAPPCRRVLSTKQAGFRNQKDTVRQLRNVVMSLEDAKLFSNGVHPHEWQLNSSGKLGTRAVS